MLTRGDQVKFNQKGKNACIGDLLMPKRRLCMKARQIATLIMPKASTFDLKLILLAQQVQI